MRGAALGSWSADGDGDRSALQLLQECAVDVDADGYVALQATPYRGHHLLAEAVLANTRPGDRVLEGGVSSGYFAELLLRAGCRVDGIELDPVAAERARRVCERVVVGDLQHIDVEELGGPYDLLLFGDTLEHVPDPVAVLRALATKLRPGGTLVVSTPNVANWAVRLSLLAGRFRYTDRGILDRTHLRFYTRSTLVEMLEQAGFRVDRVVGTIPVPLLRSKPLCRLAHAAGNLRPSLFAYTFVVTAHLPRGPAA
jgi:2-polyprenyl-3-methyl-5-hydroxy-6-metoxy-1,4-benzoquinol methylase